MFLCTSKFNIEEEQFPFLMELSSRVEIEVVNEEREDIPNQFDLDSISDNEEQDTQEQNEERDTQQAVTSDDEAHLLPTPKKGNTHLRASVRPGKRLRRKDDQFAYY